MSVTIQQIAERVGVSKPTVSYALNNKPGQVSPATRRRVLEAAEAMGYRPNWRARSFARQRSNIVGLVYGRPAEYVERSQMVSALVEQLSRLDHELMLIPATGPMDRWAHKLRDGRVDGALVTYPMPLGLDEFVAEHRLPAVFVNLRSELDVPQVSFDDLDGARRATRHLIELGHRGIMYYSAPKRHGHHYSEAERQDGYAAAMLDAGLERHLEVMTAEYDELAADLVARPAGGRPTALLVYNDYDTRCLLQHLWPLGVRVPEDLSLLTFSEEAANAGVIPPLTTMTTPAAELAARSVELLMRQIDSPGAESPSPIVLTQSLAVRASTRPL